MNPGRIIFRSPFREAITSALVYNIPREFLSEILESFENKRNYRALTSLISPGVNFSFIKATEKQSSIWQMDLMIFFNN